MRPLQQPLAGRKLAVLTVLLGGFTAFGPLSMDLYLPAFPELAADLGASQAAVQLTLTADVIGLVVGQLILGPISDARGRRTLLIGSTLVCAVASVLCALRRRPVCSRCGGSCRALPAGAGSCWPAPSRRTSAAAWRRPGSFRFL
jgi:MFS family permease